MNDEFMQDRSIIGFEPQRVLFGWSFILHRDREGARGVLNFRRSKTIRAQLDPCFVASTLLVHLRVSNADDDGKQQDHC